MMHADEGPLSRRSDETANRLPVSLTVQAAADELSNLIRAVHPDAQFALSRDPDELSTTLLLATVDTDDLDDVYDLIADRMSELRIDEDVPILVVPLHTPARAAAIFAEAKRQPWAQPAYRR
jgi:hypothetical protein